MDKNISIFINVRKNSRRCPDKLLRPFADTTLIDLLLSKVKTIRDFSIYFAAFEKGFIEKAEGIEHINFIKRSSGSANEHSDASKIFEALEHIPTEYVAWINPSHPFLKIDTLLQAIEVFKKIDAPSLTSVKKEKAWLYDADKKPITNKEHLEVDTVLSDWVYETAHAFHIYPRKTMLETNRPWSNTFNDPYLYEIPEEEAHDIDTLDEFIMIEALYKHKNKI